MPLTYYYDIYKLWSCEVYYSQIYYYFLIVVNSDLEYGVIIKKKYLS